MSGPASRAAAPVFSDLEAPPEALLPSSSCLRRVLVVGAGVAGLQTARQMLKLGLEVLVLEQNNDVGGVWTRNYHGFGLQVPWRMYEFPEFPMPLHLRSREYPSGEEVHQYVKAYARRFGLYEHVLLQTKLLRLRWDASSRTWGVLYVDLATGKFYSVEADYVVVSSGIYSQPYIPTYEGSDQYAGVQLHAKDFVDLSLARSRRVVIVGAGKTALDCVSNVVSAKTATSVTMLYRQAHWPVPRRLCGASIRALLFNRAMVGMMEPYYAEGKVAAVVAKATAPFRRLFWWGAEALIARHFKITEQLRPRVGLPKDLFYGGQILDNTMDKLIRDNDVETIKGEINRFTRNGIILQDGSFVAADLVLYCTGYVKSYEYLDGEMRSRLDLQKDGLYLYRNVLPPHVPHLAFVGSEVSTYNNILTSGLQALWLAQVLARRVALPALGALVADVREQQRWRRKVMPGQRNRGSVLMLYMMQYHDQLLRDMAVRPRRKGINIVAECFGAYTARDYEQLLSRVEESDLLVAVGAAESPYRLDLQQQQQEEEERQQHVRAPQSASTGGAASDNWLYGAGETGAARTALSMDELPGAEPAVAKDRVGQQQQHPAGSALCAAAAGSSGGGSGWPTPHAASALLPPAAGPGPGAAAGPSAICHGSNGAAAQYAACNGGSSGLSATGGVADHAACASSRCSAADGGGSCSVGRPAAAVAAVGSHPAAAARVAIQLAPTNHAHSPAQRLPHQQPQQDQQDRQAVNALASWPWRQEGLLEPTGSSLSQLQPDPAAASASAAAVAALGLGRCQTLPDPAGPHHHHGSNEPTASAATAAAPNHHRLPLLLHTAGGGAVPPPALAASSRLQHEAVVLLSIQEEDADAAELLQERDGGGAGIHAVASIAAGGDDAACRNGSGSSYRVATVSGSGSRSAAGGCAAGYAYGSFGWLCAQQEASPSGHGSSRNSFEPAPHSPRVVWSGSGSGQAAMSMSASSSAGAGQALRGAQLSAAAAKLAAASSCCGGVGGGPPGAGPAGLSASSRGMMGMGMGNSAADHPLSSLWAGAAAAAVAGGAVMPAEVLPQQRPSVGHGNGHGAWRGTACEEHYDQASGHAAAQEAQREDGWEQQEDGAAGSDAVQPWRAAAAPSAAAPLAGGGGGPAGCSTSTLGGRPLERPAGWQEEFAKFLAALDLPQLSAVTPHCSQQQQQHSHHQRHGETDEEELGESCCSSCNAQHLLAAFEAVAAHQPLGLGLGAREHGGGSSAALCSLASWGEREVRQGSGGLAPPTTIMSAAGAQATGTGGMLLSNVNSADSPAGAGGGCTMLPLAATFRSGSSSCGSDPPASSSAAAATTSGNAAQMLLAAAAALAAGDHTYAREVQRCLSGLSRRQGSGLSRSSSPSGPHGTAPSRSASRSLLLLPSPHAQPQHQHPLPLCQCSSGLRAASPSRQQPQQQEQQQAPPAETAALVTSIPGPAADAGSIGAFVP